MLPCFGGNTDLLYMYAYARERKDKNMARHVTINHQPWRSYPGEVANEESILPVGVPGVDAPGATATQGLHTSLCLLGHLLSIEASRTRVHSYKQTQKHCKLLSNLPNGERLHLKPNTTFLLSMLYTGGRGQAIQEGATLTSLSIWNLL